MNKTIYFLRHGDTDFNQKGIIQGSGVDADLNEKGREQGQAFFDYYKKIDFDLLICSALKRSYQTILPFVKLGIRHKKMAEINEMNWGVMEGKAVTPEMKATYGEMIRQWGTGNFDAKLENGESARELSDRLTVFIEALKEMPEEKILVCTHGRSLRCLMTIIKGQHLREMEGYRHSNTGLFLVKYLDGNFQVVSENDLTHIS